MRHRIKKLPAAVVSAIAAGEVAERPAVIVKELIDNAIDAEATQITITLENHGLDAIIISDNGLGIVEADLPLAIERHTTSKISTLEDFFAIETLGFRGEALASIADVAHLTIQSKPHDQELGYQLALTPHQQLSIKPAGMPNGTTVTVSNLFATVPARKKFLKSGEIELRQIVSTVMSSALANPHIGFDLYHQQKSLLHLAATDDLSIRISSLFTPTLRNSLLSLSATTKDSVFELSGFIGLPQIARRTKAQQFVFLNHRPILFPTASKVIKNVYGSLLEPKAEPVFFLNIQAPATEIDINVHPRKETARFSQEESLIQALTEAVIQTLQQTDLTYASPSSHHLSLQESSPEYDAPLHRTDRTASEATSSVLKKIVTTWQVSSSELPEVLQLHRTYLLAETKEGLLLVDQHAAHERILYEQFLAALHQTQLEPTIITLPKPIMIELSVHDSQLLQAHLETLSGIGIGLEHFGGNVFKLTSLPDIFGDRQPTALIQDLLDDLHENRELTGVDSAAHRSLAFLACRHAVKAGDVLNQEQRRELIEKLAVTNSNFTCPHGRPVSVIYHVSDLERLFKRKK